MPNELMVLLRGALAFFSMLFFTRLMGKKVVGQLTYFDFIVGITIGEIAATLTGDLSLRPLPQLVGIAEWVGLAGILNLISLRSRPLARLLSGEPTILIHNGKILERNLKVARLTFSDLEELLRDKGVFSLSDVEFAILETDGTLSVLEKSQAQPVTPGDLGLPTRYQGLSTELVQEGKIFDQNLRLLHLTKSWLREELGKQGITGLGDVVYATLDTQGRLYVDRREDNLGTVTDVDDNRPPKRE